MLRIQVQKYGIRHAILFSDALCYTGKRACDISGTNSTRYDPAHSGMWSYIPINICQHSSETWKISTRLNGVQERIP